MLLPKKNSTMPEITCPNCGAPNKTSLKYCSNCGFQLPAQVEPLATEPEVGLPERKKSNSKVIIGVVIGIVILGLSFYGASKFFGQHKGAFYDGVLTGMVQSLNKKCPMMIDEGTRMDSVTTGKGLVLKYNYTLVNLAEQLADTAAVQTGAEPSMLQMIKAEEDMKLFRERDVTFSYIYYNNKGEYLLTIAITPDEYKLPAQPKQTGN